MTINQYDHAWQFTVGRARVQNGPRRSGFNPNRFEIVDDKLSMSGVYYPQVATEEPEGEAALARAAAFVQNWLALVDESVVPVVAPTRWMITGYWEATRAGVSAIDKVTHESGAWNYSIELRRAAPGFATLAQQMTGVLANRSTAIHAVTPGSFSWLPATATWISEVTQSPRATETGSVEGRIWNDTDLGVGLLSDLSFSLPPAHFFDGSAVVEQDFGPGWHPVEGLNPPRLPGDTPEFLRFGNGLIRCTFAADGDFTVYAWDQDGTLGWQIAGVFRFGNDAAAYSGPYLPKHPTILRNTTEQVTVRYPLRTTANTAVQASIEFTVRRGDAVVSVDLVDPENLGDVSVFGNQAATGVTGGIHSTAVYTGGPHRWVIMSPYENVAGRSLGAPNPFLRVSSVTSSPRQFISAIGVNLNNHSGNANEVPEIIRQYWKIVAADQYPVFT